MFVFEIYIQFDKIAIFCLKKFWAGFDTVMRWIDHLKWKTAIDDIPNETENILISVSFGISLIQWWIIQITIVIHSNGAERYCLIVVAPQN